MLIERGQRWRMQPGLLGSESELEILSERDGMIRCRDDWAKGVEEYKVEYVMAFFEPVDPVLLAQFDKWRFTRDKNNKTVIVSKHGGTAFKKIHLRKKAGRVRARE